MAGGSLPNVPLHPTLSKDICHMKSINADGCIALGDSLKGYLIYSAKTSIPVASGKYQLYSVDLKTGDITVIQKSIRLQDSFRPDPSRKNIIYWLRRL
jgi:hypothetical protein